MAYWETGYRKVAGHRRKVRKLHRNGRIVSVRISGTKNYTDRTARKHGLTRAPRYVNNPKGNKRLSYKR
jgi:hypothetical protein